MLQPHRKAFHQAVFKRFCIYNAYMNFCSLAFLMMTNILASSILLSVLPQCCTELRLMYCPISLRIWRVHLSSQLLFCSCSTTIIAVHTRYYIYEHKSRFSLGMCCFGDLRMLLTCCYVLNMVLMFSLLSFLLSSCVACKAVYLQCMSQFFTSACSLYFQWTLPVIEQYYVSLIHIW